MIDWGNFIWQAAAVVFACGMVWAKLNMIERSLARLEQKQDKYNNLQERTKVLEVKVENHLNNHG